MKRSRKGFSAGLWACFFVLGLLLVPAARAQNLGSIVGLVTDGTGAVIPGAAVTVTNEETGLSRGFETNATGTYLASNLQPGTYTVEASSTGFKSFRRTGIELNVRDQIRVDIQLEIGELTETIEVVEQVVALKTEDAAVEDVITGKQVENIAVNGRSFLQLAALVPGASSTQPAFNTPVGVSSNAGISFNGLRANHNVWRIDGQENYDRGCGGCITTLPSIDAIQEFKVSTANTDADLGFGAAGQINVAIKSGTNEFHGTVYEFLRNDALDATNFFANLAGNPQPKLRFNNFGYNIGGPVLKNKTFFFWNQEWRKIRRDRQFFVQAPSAALRTGDFSEFGPGITDPDTGDPFPNNRIPQSRLDPNAAILAEPGLLFPLPVTSDGFFSGVGGEPINVRQEILRVDHHFNEKNHVFFRFVFDTVDQTFAATQWTGSSYPTINTLFENPPKMYHLQWSSTVSPNVVNEASVSFARQPLSLTPQGNFARPPGLNIPELFPDNRANRVPNIAFQGVLGTNINNGSWPWDNVSNTWVFRDNLLWNKGRHTFRIGGEFQPFDKQQDLFGPTQGDFIFNTSGTGHEFANFLLGRAFRYQEMELQTAPFYLTRSGGVWFMDTWRAKSNLTINWGLRWVGLPHAFEERDQVAAFFPDLFDPSRAPTVLDNGQILEGSGDSLNGIGEAGQGGIPRGLVQNHWDLFQPRIGIAWRPFGEDTVLRFGYGIYHERIQGNDIYNVGPNPPNSFTAVIFDADLSNPGGGEQATFPGFLQTYDGPYELPQIQQYNLGIQHRLSPGVVLSVGYVGTAGSYLQTVRNINQPAAEGAALVRGGQAIVNQVRPFPGWADVLSFENRTNSNYNSLQFSLRTDNWKGLTLQTAYTWSHAIDYTSGDVGGNKHQNAFNLAAERGNSDFDRRQMLIFNYVYDIPTPNRWTGPIKQVLGGWTVSGIASFQSGTPLNISLPGDHVGIGSAPFRPDLVADPELSSKSRTDFFNTDAFAQPAPGVFGSAGRNVVRGPGINNWDLSVFKSFPGILGPETSGLEFRAEFFNAFNHTQWNAVGTAFGSGAFGVVTGARDARVIQFGLKLRF